MNAKKWTALVLFALAAVFNLLGNYLGIPLMERVTKPLLMPLVLLNALLALEGTLAPRWLAALLTFALCFHCAGDILLMIPGFPFFVAGLFCFLVGHVFYISIFVRRGVFEGGSTLAKALSVTAALALVLSIVLALRFEGPVKYAVFVYGSLLLFVGVCGLWGVLNRKEPVYWLTFCGALVFLFSDFLVAWRSLLGHTFPGMGFCIMLTYISAECMIVTSIVRAQR